MMRELDQVLSGLHDDIGLDDLRRRVLAVSLTVCLLTPLGLVLVFSRPGYNEPWLVYVGLALYAVGGLAYLASRWSSAAGGGTLMVGLLAVTTGALWIPPLAWVAYLIPVLVVFAGAFANLLGSLVAAAAVSAALLLVHGLGGPIASQTLHVALILVWANILVTWLASEPIRLALRWSWLEFQRAERETDRARRQQAELARLVKSLNVAQDRLEQVNHELERARHAADDARRLKTEFAAAISHELRTPLNLIIGFSEMMVISPRLSYGEPLPEAYGADVEAIYRNSCHISSLVDDILDLSQIDAHRMGLQKQPASLRDLVQQASSGLAGRFEAMGLSLKVEVPADLPLLSVDPVRVRQILLNLLINALRFTVTGGVTIHARCGEDGREVVVSVADTGVGIASEDLPHVFEPFCQSGQSERRRGGSGLGLTVSKRFVEMHGGAMWVDSELGRGSIFHLSLPVCENVVVSPHASEAGPLAVATASPAERTVVVLDEVGETTRILQRYLDGYTAVRAESIERTVQIVSDRPVEAVLVSSAEIPAGWRQLQLTSERLSRLPVITCPLHTVRPVARESGVVEHLTKPVTREQLAAALRTIRIAGGSRSNGTKRPRSVLVADDDPEMVRLLVRMIHSSLRRCQVWTAYDGAECLELLEAKQPDVLFLDLLMPRLDGYAVLEKMRADGSLRGVPVVVITAKGNQEETVVASALGVSRPGGLSVAETIRCLRSSLDALAASC
ncbi:MAG: response regulator [Chloroflexi bacterium]|nr:response regulator [Chloroflexota bacterium]